MPSVGRVLQGLLLLAALSLVVGQLLGQPVLLGFVTSGSMAPTLAAGDGFVAVPGALAGEPQVGDVVTFRAETVGGGGLVTHRVVGETERGYITRGDANPFTDQDAGEPPVREAQVVAHALQLGGWTVVVPGLGTVVTGVAGLLAGLARRLEGLGLGSTGLALLLLGTSVAAFLADARAGGRARSRVRERTRGVDGRLVVGALAGLVVVTATASMVLPGGVTALGLVSAEADSPGPRVVPAGETETTPYPVANDGVLPVHVVLETSDGLAVDPARLTVGAGGRTNATLAVTAPPETGYYRRFVVEHRYLAVLPRSATVALHGVHPWLPIAVIDGLLGVPLYVLGVRLVGRGRVRLNAGREGASLRDRLRRLRP